MSVTPLSNSASQTQALANQISAEVDTNKDGQISTSEFSTFILNVLQGNSSLNSGASALRSAIAATAPPSASTSTLTSLPNFLGFDASRAVTAVGTLKYDAYNILKNYDPRDPAAMKNAWTQLNALHPGLYELDSQDNLMLTGTADGYIGARPINRDSDWNNRNQDWAWQWMGYNPAHPGPNGEVT